MRSGTITRTLARLACLACLSAQIYPTLGDEPSRLGRLFRMGSPSDTSKPASTPTAGLNSASPPLNAATSSSSTRSVSDFYGQPALSTPPSSSGAGSSLTPTPRINPKPRVNKPITEADPLVSRVAIGRGDGGSQFAMFTQIYADGTVIDSVGVHKIAPDLLKPVVEAVTTGDFGKIKGHCGGPAGDTFENYQVVTYERAYGRLRANAFSYSGTPQGCDHAVHHLNKVLDELEIKMATPGAANATTTPSVVGSAPVASTSANAPSYISAPVPMSPSGGNLSMPGLPDPGLH